MLLAFQSGWWCGSERYVIKHYAITTNIHFILQTSKLLWNKLYRQQNDIGTFYPIFVATEDSVVLHMPHVGADGQNIVVIDMKTKYEIFLLDVPPQNLFSTT